MVDRIEEINGTKFRKLKEDLDGKTAGGILILGNERNKDFYFRVIMEREEPIVFMYYSYSEKKLKIDVDKINSFSDPLKLKIRFVLSKIGIKI